MPNDHKPAEPGSGQAGRRAFLTLAGVVAAAVPVSSFLAACESGRSPGGTAAPAGRSAGSTVAAPCAPSPCAGLGAGTAPALTDWHTLRRSLSTKELIQPGQGGYTTARELFDPRFDAIEPAGIAYCRTPQDVSACLAFVRRFGLPVAARSGGHSYGGWSSSTGLVVDVTQMNSFQVAAGGNTVQVGTGTRLVDFYNGLAAHGLAVPGGSSPRTARSWNATPGETVTCCGRAAAAAAATSAWPPRSPSAPGSCPGWSFSSCPGPGHRRPRW